MLWTCYSAENFLCARALAHFSRAAQYRYTKRNERAANLHKHMNSNSKYKQPDQYASHSDYWPVWLLLFSSLFNAFFQLLVLNYKKSTHTHSPNYIIIAIPIQMNNSAYTPLIVPKKNPPRITLFSGTTMLWRILASWLISFDRPNN